MSTKPTIQTLGDLKKSLYKPLSVKEEMRKNLIAAIKNKQNPFHGIEGYENSVIPQLQTAVLSRHNIILLGLRGQAKTRLARLMLNLLDEWIPVVAGSEINDDPLQPLSRFAIDLIQEQGDSTPITWMHRSERYTEKLATPDVSISDLVGDVDPIKAASLKLHYNDERVIHFGLIPRSHRCIFVINELPDLQARIQVSLFNILQEGDMQIRGFKLRLPLDVQFIFTANPEDYTNRGSIVTPLKDRIDSQIITHYPKTIETAKRITQQEAKITEEQKSAILIPELLPVLIEQIAMEARQSELVDQKSGVSARLTISAFENLYSSAERRILLNNELQTRARLTDLFGAIPSITGKVELVYEGELEGAGNVALTLIGKAIRAVFLAHFPDPEKAKKAKKSNPYSRILNWFNDGMDIKLGFEATHQEYIDSLNKVDGLIELVAERFPTLNKEEQSVFMELVLYGLSEFSQLSRHTLNAGMEFKDLMSGMFNLNKEDEFKLGEE